MKLLHLTRSEYGGAGEYISRLNKGLVTKGFQSQVMFQSSLNKTDESIKIRVLKKLQTYVFKDDNDFFHSFNVSSFGDKKEFLPIFANYDIIHLHAINNFISINDLVFIRKFNKECRIFWTVHSLWNITGGCVLPNSCLNYNIGCQNCPVARKILSPIVTYEWSKKIELIKKLNITLVPNSEYVSNILKDSAVPEKYRTHKIIYPLIDKNFISIDSRKKKLTKEVKLGFCVRSLNDINKGIQKLISSPSFLSLSKKYNLKLVFVGEGELNMPDYYNYEYRGLLKEKAQLLDFYKDIDVLLHPSKSETFGMVCLESIFVMKPVVAFDIGGIPEIINHKKNGYLASAYDFFDFVKGVDWVLENYTSLQASFFNDTIEKFDPEKIITDQINLYKQKL